MTRVRVACIGTGFIAGKHLAALSGFPDVEVVAVADAVEERARAAAATVGARSYADGLELLATEELDAVWLCVPPFVHGALEEAALERDLPFFVEKPLARDLDTALGIAERVRARGLRTAVGYHWRYLSVVEEALRLVRDAPPRLVTGHWLDKTPPTPWWVRREQSGGQVVEQTTHILDLARLLVGEVESLQALEQAAGTDADGELVPHAVTALTRFASGAVGSFSSARVLHGRHRVALHLVGDGYALELSERSLVDHTLRWSSAAGERVEQVTENPIAREDRAFLDAVLGTADDVRAPYDEAVRSHALAWAVDRAARTGATLTPEAGIGHG